MHKLLKTKIHKSLSPPTSLPPFWETSFNSCGSTYSQGNSLKISWAPCKQCMSENLKINQKRANMFSSFPQKVPAHFLHDYIALLPYPVTGTITWKYRWASCIQPANHLNTTHWRGGFPGGSLGKRKHGQYRRHRRRGFAPWVGKITWRRQLEATHSSILAWRIPWTEKPGGL